MNIRITNPRLVGEQAKFVVNDDDRMAHTWYVIGRELFYLLADRLQEPFDDGALAVFEGQGMVVEIVPDKQQTGYDRVALFCKWYKHYKGLPYKATGIDGKRLKEFGSNLTEPLLKFYLDDTNMPDTPTTWLFKGKQSIANLLRYWNEVHAAMAAPAPSRHPNHWSREHYNKLDGPGITEYFRHLKSLGLEVVKHRNEIVDFRPTQP